MDTDIFIRPWHRGFSQNNEMTTWYTRTALTCCLNRSDIYRTAYELRTMSNSPNLKKRDVTASCRCSLACHPSCHTSRHPNVAEDCEIFLEVRCLILNDTHGFYLQSARRPSTLTKIASSIRSGACANNFPESQVGNKRDFQILYWSIQSINSQSIDTVLEVNSTKTAQNSLHHAGYCASHLSLKSFRLHIAF